MTRLSARGLVHAYEAQRRAVDGVDFDCAGGEWVALVGPNGSGKSTLLKLCSGLLAAEAGTVTVDGRAIGGLEPKARARCVALLPQYLPALPDVRVLDFVLSGRYAHVRSRGELGVRDRAVAEDALRRSDAAQFAERALHELSGGQRQRVVVARALAQEAAVLLVDEPTTALDPEHQIAVCDLLASLAGEGRAVCVVTHDLVLASQYATRCVLMDQGRVVRDGPLEEVLVPGVLAPVYGDALEFGRWPVRAGEAVGRPLVLPRRRA